MAPSLGDRNRTGTVVAPGLGSTVTISGHTLGDGSLTPEEKPDA